VWVGERSDERKKVDHGPMNEGPNPYRKGTTSLQKKLIGSKKKSPSRGKGVSEGRK